MVRRLELDSSLPLAGRLSRHVYETLRDRLLSGDLAAGSALSVEAVRSELGVSKQPVMEAARLLAADGLLERLRRRRVEGRADADNDAWAAGSSILTDQVTVTGTAAEVRAKVDYLGEIGITEIAYQPLGDDIPRELERFIEAAQTSRA